MGRDAYRKPLLRNGFLPFIYNIQIHSKLQFYFNSDVELHKYTTHNSHKKKGMKRAPQGETMMMSLEKLSEFVDEKLRLVLENANNTEMLISF